MACALASSCADWLTGPTPCGVAAADSTSWQFLGLASQSATSIARGADGSVYVGTPESGVWKEACATRNGAWRQSGLVSRRVGGLLSVTVRGRDLLFAAAGHSTPAMIFYSRDGARSWLRRDGGMQSQFSGNSGALTLIEDATAPGRLIAGLSGSVMVSPDIGESWSVTLGIKPSDPSAVGSLFNALAIAPTQSGTRVWAGGMFIDTNGFAYYSDDGGVTWRQTATRPGDYLRSDNNFVTSLLADSGDRDHLLAGFPNGIWETRDAGATWSEPLRTARVSWIMALVRTGRGLIAVSTEYEFPPGAPVRSLLGAYASHDNGGTWGALAVPPEAHGGTSAIAENDSTVLVGTEAGVWRFRLP